MANVCMVSYQCEAKKEQLEELNAVLNLLKAMKASVVRNDRGRLWLGCVVNQLGGDWHDVECRGEVVDFGYKGGTSLWMEQETDWCEQEGFRKFLENRFPGLKVFYLEIEPGEGWGRTNDSEGKYFPERYYLSSSEGFTFFNSLAEAAAAASQILGLDISPDFDVISSALDAFTDNQDWEDDIYYNFYEIEVE